jgi:hypothetical protein
LVNALARIDKLIERVFKASAIILVKSRGVEAKTPRRVDRVPETPIDPADFIPTKKSTPVRVRRHL